MAHEHSVIDKDTHFIIDPVTMAISCAGTVKPLKRGDHAAERYTFEMPRYIEGHDMSLCNKVEAHYNNLHYDSSTRETTTNSSFDEVDGFQLADENTVTWTWLVKGDATQLDGTLNFCIRFACMNGEEIEYQKFTEIFASIPVGQTIWNTEKIAAANVDALERLKVDILEAAADKVTTIELLASGWVVGDELHSQVVTVSGVTPNSKVDLQLTTEQLSYLYAIETMLTTGNDNGVITVYAIGAAPAEDMTVQALISEVLAV